MTGALKKTSKCVGCYTALELPMMDRQDRVLAPGSWPVGYQKVPESSRPRAQWLAEKAKRAEEEKRKKEEEENRRVLSADSTVQVYFAAGSAGNGAVVRGNNNFNDGSSSSRWWRHWLIRAVLGLAAMAAFGWLGGSFWRAANSPEAAVFI
ncbi:hypothetical protein LX36DRAFT_670872 [Colletotrichum falcatum]|nr:hypothetical protein LX36DRAFT_670872 [Colletotrichum falcatum]